MRRLVTLPAIILLAVTVYGAAEARQAVIKHQQLELAKFESTVLASAPDGTRLLPPAEQQAMASLGVSTLASNPAPNVLNGPAGAQPAQTPAKQPAKANDPHVRDIIISIPDRQLALLEDGKLVKTYPIAVGTRFSPSPEGDFKIINHAIDPVYRHKGKEIHPGKENPLGTRWMGLSLKGYGIHGTNVPRSIGKAASHGCFRMAKQDVEDLYSRVRVGDSVKVRSQRDEQMARIFAPQTALPTQAAAGPELQVAYAAGTESAAAAAPATEQ
jgi:lipoprotein-anchoring transpeptidase ErfK/SrfK